jgi:hypothetical protein
MDIIGVVVGIVSVIVAILIWLFPPEPLRKKIGLQQKKDYELESLQFLLRLGELSDNYWDKVDKPLTTNLISPFQEKCSQFFQISFEKFVDDVDPSFDITIVNDLKSTVVIHEIGMEIVSIAHEMKFYGPPQASKILQQATYEIEVPDIRANIELEMGRFPRLLEPRNINKSLLVSKTDIFRIEPESTLRYELLLKNYVVHMPNYALLRFWVTTQKRKYTSELIHIFTI